MKEQEIRPLPEPDVGEYLELSGGSTSLPDLILGMAIGMMGTFLVMFCFYVLTEVCGCG